MLLPSVESIQYDLYISEGEQVDHFNHIIIKRFFHGIAVGSVGHRSLLVGLQVYKYTFNYPYI